MSFTPEQDMLRDTVHSFLEREQPLTRVRELMEDETGYDRAIWAEMAELGISGVHIPEDLGGSGFSHVELGIVLEEMGRMLTPSPMFSTIVLGANLLMLAGTDEQQKEMLPPMAAGERTATVALLDEGGTWDAPGALTTATADGDDVVLDGVKSFVIDGHTADTLLVAAADDDGTAFFIVDAAADGVGRQRLETMDMTRKQARITLDGVRVPSSSRLAGAESTEIAGKLYDLAGVALAFEAVGGAQRCLDMSVGYATVRHQFGRPIGSFQAVKHKCADMLVQVETARSTAYHAGSAASSDPNELSVVAPLAKSYCADAYFFCAAENIQVHGGIGFTWEHDAHLYFKRAKTSQLLFGDAASWRRKLADRIGL